ncbi:MAG TPA: AMP-binding protein [Candidatus Acidoferrales bacterium]|jgi:long-chain acyl-CoA synthetase|nr:AMP-binding protein [Candidatus Acidoferrales bacterium]
MTFLESIFARLERSPNSPVLGEVRDGGIVSVTGAQLLALVGQARGFVAARGLKSGDRCAVLAPNSVRWVALDLALMAEGVIVVPLDPRQVPHEIAAVIKDSTPLLVCCSKPEVDGAALFDDIFSGKHEVARPPLRHADHDAVTIVYTSGTSGEPKGVLLTAGNITFMLGCTNARLNQLMGARQEPENVFQYAPFCFAAARILLLTSLSRNSVLTLSTDLTRLAEELAIAAPNYFVNVPMFLERVRRKIEESIQKRGGFAAEVFSRAQRTYQRKQSHSSRAADSLWLAAANSLIFPAIRRNVGPNLKALICGSAPLSADTQLFFMMIGIPVLQVYGLTETTAICTMDEPGNVEPGRVGRAVPGVEMTAAENGEILVRGPHIFPGYWQRPAETAKVLEGGWFHTGDQGEADPSGNWRITGRLKNLIILNSGHNIAPEPLEQALVASLPEAQQVVLLGNQRSFLAALVTTNGSVNGARNGVANGIDCRVNGRRIQSVLDSLNAGLPHYKQIRAFQVLPEPFSVENGLLTTMGKLKRDAIAERFAAEIEKLYQKKSA